MPGQVHKTLVRGGWRDGSVLTDCSLEGQEFNSYQSHGGSQPSAIRSDALSGVSEKKGSVCTH